MKNFLGEVAEIILGGTPSTLKTEFWDGDIPWVTPGDIGVTKHVDRTERTITEAGLHGSNTKLLEIGDVIISARGSVGKIVECDRPMAFNQSCYALKTKNNKVLAQTYLYYLLHQCVAYLRQNSAGAVFNAIIKTTLERTPINLPPVKSQHSIASILSAYDDLNENNRRRIQLLEESARLLYKEWFVYLRFPGHEHVKIVNGAPEGWEKKPLSELTDYLSRGITPHYDDEANGIVINQKCIRNGQIDLSLARHQSKEFAPVRQLLVGDVLINSTGEGTLGRVAQVKSPISNCTVDTHITVVRPKEELGVHYFGMALMALEPLFSTMGRGATNQTELSRAAIGETTILVPAYSLIRNFNEYVHPTYQQISTITIQNQKLRQARDLLLPRLMNGEIEV